MNLNIINNDKEIKINIDKISLIAESVLKNTLFGVGIFKTKKLHEIELYKSELLEKSKYFEEYDNLNQELLNFLSENRELSDYLIPVSSLVSLEIVVNAVDMEKFLCLISTIEMQEIREIFEKIKENYVTDNSYFQNNLKLKNFILENYSSEENNDEIGLFAGIEDKDRVNIIFEGDFDNQISTSILYKNLSGEGISIEECIDIVEEMDNSDKDVLMRLALGNRQKWDFLPNVFGHSTIMYDLILDFSTYRFLTEKSDSFGIFTGATAILGYDYCEFIERNEEIKEKYDDLMTKITIFTKGLPKEEKDIFFYSGAGGHLVRTTLELTPINLVELLELGSDGNDSFKRLQQEMFTQFKKLSPIFSRYIKV